MIPLPDRVAALLNAGSRDYAVLADVLAHLHGQLNGADAATAAHTDEVQQLVSAALQELQRFTAHRAPVGTVAPVLGSGVVAELIRSNRLGLVGQPPATVGRVDTKR